MPWHRFDLHVSKVCAEHAAYDRPRNTSRREVVAGTGHILQSIYVSFEFQPFAGYIK
jgi:hypothetical protein